MLKCFEEFKYANFYVSVFMEGIAVAFLVFIGGTVLIRADIPNNIYVTEASIVLGITLAVLSQCLKDISGAHINPAITVACTLTRRISLLRGLCYIIFQCGGGILGAFALQEMTPYSKRKTLAMTILSSDISLPKGIGYEMIFTFIYAWVYFSSKTSKDQFKGFGGPFAVGSTYGISHVVILQYTGCSLNPARSLGPAVIMEQFDDHWIYWAGPILSASLAGLLHDFIFARAKNKMYPRPRSASLICCKPSREEVVLTELNEQQYRENYVVKRPDVESGV